MHALPSLQSPSSRQQPTTLLKAQVPALHVSLVQGLPSLQSVAVAQLQAIGVNLQVWVGTSQLSVVQAVWSLQSPAASQQSDVGSSSAAVGDEVARVGRASIAVVAIGIRPTAAHDGRAAAGLGLRVAGVLRARVSVRTITGRVAAVVDLRVAALALGSARFAGAGVAVVAVLVAAVRIRSSRNRTGKRDGRSAGSLGCRNRACTLIGPCNRRRPRSSR